ncbi:MAG: endonuclease/exonuclease/phosphatase family protein [Rikenellaceae bacterium]|nr:endonuclease/exonuclease/phosphatase family protein [Rikenellaceae bacterium]
MNHLLRLLFLLMAYPMAFYAAGQEGIVAFYNVENLFDLADDPASDDDDFTPEGAYRWDEQKYRHKLGQLARVIRQLDADLVGLAEVENATVLEALADSVAHSATSEGITYRFVHFDSPDPRGIDVALLYRPEAFLPESMHPVAYRYLPGYPTRQMLHVAGRWNGTPVHLLVCHLPSATSSAVVRADAAASVAAYADSLMRSDPERLLVVMGDFNANPGSRPMNTLVRATGLRNYFEPLYRRGIGSYLYRGGWNMYDSILVGGALNRRPEVRVFVHDDLIQPDGSYRGYPFRSFSGTQYIGGYSDHLPVLLSFQ